jgi:RNA polymerase sigma factor (sigma-70 family)
MSGGRVVTSRAKYTDEQLALAVQAGDRVAEHEIVARYTGLAYSLAWPYVTLRSDFDDMRQEALLGVLAAARTFRVDGGATFKGLAVLAIRRRLFTVIKTDNTMGRKAEQATVSINAPILLDGKDEPIEGTIADPFAHDPHDVFERSDRLKTLVDVVRDRLSPMEREALIGYLNGRTLTDIFDSIGRTSTARHPDGRQRPKTAENALDRARAKLRVALEESPPLGAAA